MRTWSCQNLRNCRLGGRRVRQHSWQYTGRPSVGLKGTSHSSPQSEHTALCIVRGLRSRLTQLNIFSPRFHYYVEKIKFSELFFERIILKTDLMYAQE